MSPARPVIPTDSDLTKFDRCGRMPGNRPGTWVCVGEDAQAVINFFGDIMSGIPK